MKELQEELASQQRGLRIFEIAGGYQMGSAPELAPLKRPWGEGIG